jgi:hypothetical protein
MNASAIDRKFYTMALMLDDVKQGVTVLIKHRWENFLRRINIINNTTFDMNDVNISIGSNLPSMEDETINQQLALNGILSQKTLLSNLGYDYATEKKNKEEEQEVPYNIVAPDTAYVTPSSATTQSSTPATSTDTNKTTSQTNNQIEAKTQTTTTSTVVKDKTDNIHSTQTREGRPNI